MIKPREKRQSNQDSTVGLFVALYLILLAVFIVLTKDLTFDNQKKTVAMRSLQETFGGPMEQKIIFGRLEKVNLEEYALEIEKITKGFAKVLINNSEDVVRVNIPINEIYFADEPNFRDERLADMTRLISILKRWGNNDNLSIIIELSETKFELDKKRLDFFIRHLSGKNNMVGISLDGENQLTITVQVTA